VADPLKTGLSYVGWDLLFGVEPDDIVTDFLGRTGMTDQRLQALIERGSPERHIIGFDYYLGNDRADEGGLYGIGRRILDRYAAKLGHAVPCMLSEINGCAPWIDDFLARAWHDALRLQADGDCVGAMYYSLVDQADWDHFANRAHGHILPIGLYDVERQIRPAGERFRALVAEHRAQLGLTALTAA
jgi:hypothetical protein